MDDADLLPEGDACHAVGLRDKPGHRVWLRRLVDPVIVHKDGRTLRRYRRADLDAAAIHIAEGLTRHAHNLRHE